jgi:hypothetical protein
LTAVSTQIYYVMDEMALRRPTVRSRSAPLIPPSPAERERIEVEIDVENLQHSARDRIVVDQAAGQQLIRLFGSGFGEWHFTLIDGAMAFSGCRVVRMGRRSPDGLNTAFELANAEKRAGPQKASATPGPALRLDSATPLRSSLPSARDRSPSANDLPSLLRRRSPRFDRRARESVKARQQCSSRSCRNRRFRSPGMSEHCGPCTIGRRLSIDRSAPCTPGWPRRCHSPY